MPDALIRYFEGEKQQGYFWFACGVAALVAALVLWRGKSDYRAACWPLGIVALVQLGAGIWLLTSTEGRVAGLLGRFAENPEALTAAELARIEKTMTLFTVLKIVEIVLLAAGIGLVFAMRARPVWFAVGVGLIVQSSAMLVLDIVASRRAEHYLAALRAASTG